MRELRKARSSFRGQSATEFIFTYGWAIAIAFIGVTALYVYGVFDASKYLPRECVIQPTLRCDSYRVGYNDSWESGSPPFPPFVFRLATHNGLGYDIQVTGFEIYTENLGARGKATYAGECATPGGSAIAPSGMSIVCAANVTDAASMPRLGDAVSLNFKMTYLNLETDTLHVVYGSATTQVEREIE